nr:NFX1-type zinc finger-containing protein 1-like [Ipomoea batatas]
MAANVNSAGQSRSEKYGAWMLVTRKDRRNRPNRANQSGYGRTFDRRQEMPTHSRFASLESLEETNLAQDQINLERGLDLQQPEDALPRIITNGKKNQRSPVQSNSGTHRKPSRAVSGRQMAYRGGYQSTNRGGYQSNTRGGYQAATWSNYRSGYRGGNSGRDGRGGVPNRAAAEAEHTVVRGSNHGRNITTTVVHHAYGQPDLSALAGIDHSPKDDPPDDEQIGGDNISSDAVMIEDDGPGEPFGFVANSHMRS